MSDTGANMAAKGGGAVEWLLWAAAPSVISGAALLVVGWTARKVASQLKAFQSEHAVLLESQRNQLKAKIVEIYESSSERGCVSTMELDVFNRLADSYFALGGNHYVHALVKRMNEEMSMAGEPVE